VRSIAVGGESRAGIKTCLPTSNDIQGGYSLVSCLLAEVVLTAFFLLIILGSTDGRAPKGFAPLAIGLGLTLIHLIGIPITNTSVNPARSTGPAIFAGGWALSQLWLFWIAPLIGGVIGGGIYRALFAERVEISGDEAVNRSPERLRAA